MIWDNGCNLYPFFFPQWTSFLNIMRETSVLDWIIVPNYTCLLLITWFCRIFHCWCLLWAYNSLAPWNVGGYDGNRGIKCVWVIWLQLFSICHYQNEKIEALNLTCILEPSLAKFCWAQPTLNKPSWKQLKLSSYTDSWGRTINGCL